MSWKNYLRPSKRLREAGLLGMNQRNGDYILRYNPRKYYPLVDDKLRTKKLAQASGIAVPELYAVVDAEYQIADLPEKLKPYDEFAIKPAHGSGGEGIIVVNGRSKNCYRKLNGTLLTEEEIGHHISNILSGMYSLGGQPDVALIEYRVDFDPVFDRVSYQGVPDIRTIIFMGVPVMSMLRLPTRLSDGKANLHQGAIGVGIDIEQGVTTTGVWQNDMIDAHPDSGNTITGLSLPNWEDILLLSAGCKELVSLGYIGVDIVLDSKLGPLMLEINARPGLSIQLANKKGLLPRLEAVEKLKKIPETAAERVELAKKLYRTQ
ncbi:alpha-L-glutamate ligase-like protein [Methylotuvimicrobium buryatense]|uniref:Alpha-L-glutamate ligase-like protein n=1 Tax=Methylotuvimicrobium buryatense TaxID=95641 RepID=A0A4P9UQH8_METBY|nr:alpha-L-glutamate ligase-like protein [Methylotuvimicrobium buryatense]QCW83587.1 alpha-L-glutamate ligase-like protein [Methylotuvimicrobium buryatense]